MNFTEAKAGGYDERSFFLEEIDLSWAEKYISSRRYIHKRSKRTLAQIIVPKRALFGIKGGTSHLEVFRGAFKGKGKTEDELLSIIRDHEGKHAHLSFQFPEIFDLNSILRPETGLEKIRRLVEEIVCDEFQLHEIERNGMHIRPKQLKGLKKEVKRTKKKLGNFIDGRQLGKKSQGIIDILNGDHRHSDEIRFGT